MRKLFLALLLVAGCVTKPPINTGPVPTCDVVCNHITNELKCPDLTTTNQRGCMVICDNLFESAESGILNCWEASKNCTQLDTCDQ
jgi:hypothetical protein